MKGLQRRCKNPNCGCHFTPSKYRPDQEYCGRVDCKRYRDRIRQRLFYRRNIRDAGWRASLKRRKKKERAARLKTSNPVLSDSASSLSDIQLLLPGMIALFSGARNEKEIVAITDKCRRFGRNLNQGNLCGPEVFQIFPHVRFEAKKECSLRQF